MQGQLEERLDIQYLLSKIPFENVTQAVKGYALDWVTAKKHLLLYFVPGIFLLVCFGVFFGFGEEWYYFWLGLPLLALGFYFVANGEKLFFQSLASAWGWGYVRSVLSKDFGGRLNFPYSDRYVDNVLVKEFEGAKVLFGTASHTYSVAGKDRIERIGVLKYDLQYSVPTIYFLKSSSNFAQKVDGLQKNLYSLKLEVLQKVGYVLLVEEKLEIEALQLFKDDVVNQLYEKSNGCSFEFVGSDVYVYSPTSIADKNDLRILLETTDYLVKVIGPKLASIQGSTRAMQEAKADKVV